MELKKILLLLVAAVAVGATVWIIMQPPQKQEVHNKVPVQRSYVKISGFDEKRYPTPNYDRTLHVVWQGTL